MRRIIMMLTFLLCSVRGLYSMADAPALRIDLAIVPETTLPGIPVTFRITFTNPTFTPLSVPAHGLLVATDDAGQSFLLWPKPIQLQDLRSAPVQPGDSVVVELRPRGSFNDASYSVGEPRLNRPGEFQIHLLAGKFMAPEGFLGVPSGGSRSADARLHVVEPVGVDRQAWLELSKNRRGGGMQVWGPSPEEWALGSRILRLYPDSQYAGWIAASGISESSHENAEALRAWLARSRRDEYTEARELRLALFDDAAARQWTQISDVEVLRHVRSARAILERLRNSSDLNIASRARQQLKEVEETEENVRERGPRAP